MNEITLQYISQGAKPKDHLQNIENACKAGVKWVQLRLKEVDNATYLTTAIQCRNICDQYGSIMIINDNVSIAKASLADGVHLGLQDMNPVEARKLLGDNFIIGGTANTIKDCLQQAKNNVDYIGLGPFRYTETKEQLSPVLGIDGYESIISEFKLQYSELPIIAIGGIQKNDMDKIMRTGVSGVAVSSMLTDDEELQEKVAYIKEKIAIA